MWKMIGFGLLGLIGLVALVFGLKVLGFMGASFFNPWGEQIRRDTHIQSQAYNEGQIQNLRKLRLEYIQAESDAERTAIRLSAMQMVGQMDQRNLPEDLRVWVNAL